MMKKIIYLVLVISTGACSVYGQQKLGMLEYVYNATVKIQTVDSVVKKNGEDVPYGGYGTGFFFLFETNKGSVPAIVTNRHVLNAATTITFFFLEADKAGLPLYGKPQKVTLNKKDIPVFNHPDNSVDLAIIPVNPILDYFRKQNINISFHSLDESVIPKDSLANTLNTVEDLYVIGHPVGLQEELSNTPVVKKAVTATPLYLDHNRKKEFLAEFSVYDGSCGAPVILYQVDKSNRTDMKMMGQRVLLVGIHCTAYAKGFTGKVFPMGRFPRNEQETTPSYEDMGIVIKSQRLLDFKKLLSGLKK